MREPWMDKYVTFENLAQGFHIFLSEFVVEHLGRYAGHRWLWLTLVLAFWAWKEGYYDKHNESPQVAGSGWVDFASGALGAVIGFLLV